MNIHFVYWAHETLFQACSYGTCAADPYTFRYYWAMGSWWQSQLPNILEMLKECSLTRPWYQNSSLPQQTMVSLCNYLWLYMFILYALLVVCIAHAFLHDTCTIHVLLLKIWCKDIIIQMYLSLAQFKRSIFNILLHAYSIPVNSIILHMYMYMHMCDELCWKLELFFIIQ